MSARLCAWRVLAVALAACAILAVAAVPHAARAATEPGERAPIQRVGGVPCVSAGDLARLLDASLYWRPETRKLLLRAQGYRLTLTVDAPLVLVDDRTVRLDAPVRSVGGELQVPVSLLALLPRDTSAVRLTVEAGGTHVRAMPATGWVGSPRVTVTGDVTRVTLASAHAREVKIAGNAREHFRLWVPGVAGGGAPDSLPAGALVTGLHRLPAPDGVTWEFVLARGVAGFRRSATADAVTLEFARAGSGLEPLAPEAPAGARAVRVIVLDPAHGGADAGVLVPGAVEKDLALQLAKLLAPELERRTGAHVVLTRDADRDLAQPERAEMANRARADLVISLHFDGAPLTRARGATAWCPAPVSAAADAAVPSGGIAMTRWRDVAVRHSVESRSLADAVTAALEARGLGPARVRERLPVALLGVNAPGIALECATLTSADDVARVSAPDGLRALAVAIADGVRTWERHE